MSEFGLLDQTVQWLEEAPIHGQTLDEKVRRLLQAEYLRQLSQYQRQILALTRKYDMDFNQFTRHRIPEKQGYSWESETDAMQWETAVSGIQTIERKLAELSEA